MSATMTMNREEATAFAADVESRMRQCDNGEGIVCASLDRSLYYYGDLCAELHRNIRQWIQDVLYRHVDFDAMVEEILRREGTAVSERSRKLLKEGYESKEVCFTLEGLNYLDVHSKLLDHLLVNWVTPQASISHGAMAKAGGLITPEAIAEAKKKLAALKKKQ